jgi:hypothetical protein
VIWRMGAVSVGASKTKKSQRWHSLAAARIVGGAPARWPAIWLGRISASPLAQ